MDAEKKNEEKKEPVSGLRKVPETPVTKTEKKETVLCSLQELKVEFLPSLRERGGMKS